MVRSGMKAQNIVSYGRDYAASCISGPIEIILLVAAGMHVERPLIYFFAPWWISFGFSDPVLCSSHCRLHGFCRFSRQYFVGEFFAREKSGARKVCNDVPVALLRRIPFHQSGEPRVEAARVEFVHVFLWSSLLVNVRSKGRTVLDRWIAPFAQRYKAEFILNAMSDLDVFAARDLEPSMNPDGFRGRDNGRHPSRQFRRS